MAIKFACDGCQKLMDQAEAKHRGTVIVKQYCDTCVVDVDSFLSARDAVHTSAAERYRQEMHELTSRFYASHPNGMLPDANQKP